MRRSGLILLLFLLPALSACPTGEGTGVYYDANANADADAASEDPVEAETPQAEVVEGRKRLAFTGITVEPEAITLLDEITAEATLVEGASSFAEVEYTWYVNDRDLRGVHRNVLDPRTGRYRRGDKIRVTASAMDERGQIATVESGTITIVNSTPRILNTDVDKRVGIDGLVMRAEDPDGDPISWSILSGPPGVEIEAGGRIRVRQVDLEEAFDGEVVVAASDPEGARVEWHIPVTVNAAREEVLGEQTTTTERTRLDMTDEEYERINLESLDRVMQMDDQQFEEYSQQQEEREQEYLEKERKKRKR